MVNTGLVNSRCLPKSSFGAQYDITDKSIKVLCVKALMWRLTRSTDCKKIDDLVLVFKERMTFSGETT